MPQFTKQPEAVATYEKYGFKYPDEVLPDTVHEDFMKMTEKSPEPLNFCYITNMKRLMIGLDKKEYVVYSLMFRRTDYLGNYKHSFLSNMGFIPKLEPVTRIKRDEETGWERKYVARLNIVGKDYIIPWEGKKTIEKLIKKYGNGCIRDISREKGRQELAQDQKRREKWAEEHDKVLYRMDEKEHTQFTIQKDGEHWSAGIGSFDDFVQGDFEELYRHRKIRTPLERRYDEMRRFGRELNNEEREIEKGIPFLLAPGNKLDTLTETAEMEFRKVRGEEPYK